MQLLDVTNDEGYSGNCRLQLEDTGKTVTLGKRKVFWTHLTKVNLLCSAVIQQNSWWCLEQEGMAASLVSQFQSLIPELCRGQSLC